MFYNPLLRRQPIFCSVKLASQDDYECCRMSVDEFSIVNLLPHVSIHQKEPFKKNPNDEW